MSVKDKALAEAERRYPDTGDESNGFLGSLPRIEDFCAGAEWQSKQPIEITDDMVERAEKYLADHADDYDTGGGWTEWPAASFGEVINARELLDAALNGGNHGDSASA